MSISLALGGGAARGAFHLGFLHYCEKNHIEIKAYSGSSIGAIISASHASGVSAKEQLKIFSSKEIRECIKFNYFRNALFKIDFNHKIVEELLPIKRVEDIPKPLFLTSFDIKEKKLHYFDRGDTLPLCLGSSALIPLFKPIKYKSMLLIDGGLFDNVPIKPLESFEYEIHSVDLLPRKNLHKTKRVSITKLIKRNLLKQLYKNHKYSLENSTYYLGSHHIRSFSLFTFKELEECFKLGFKEAKEHFNYK